MPILSKLDIRCDIDEYLHRLKYAANKNIEKFLNYTPIEINYRKDVPFSIATDSFKLTLIVTNKGRIVVNNHYNDSWYILETEASSLKEVIMDISLLPDVKSITDIMVDDDKYPAKEYELRKRKVNKFLSEYVNIETRLAEAQSLRDDLFNERYAHIGSIFGDALHARNIQ
jgi:hypothetical protein